MYAAMPFYTAEREPLKNHYKISDYEERYHREHDWFMPREPRLCIRRLRQNTGGSDSAHVTSFTPCFVQPDPRGTGMY